MLIDKNLFLKSGEHYSFSEPREWPTLYSFAKHLAATLSSR